MNRLYTKATAASEFAPRYFDSNYERRISRVSLCWTKLLLIELLFYKGLSFDEYSICSRSALVAPASPRDVLAVWYFQERRRGMKARVILCRSALSQARVMLSEIRTRVLREVRNWIKLLVASTVQCCKVADSFVRPGMIIDSEICEFMFLSPECKK